MRVDEKSRFVVLVGCVRAFKRLADSKNPAVPTKFRLILDKWEIFEEKWRNWEVGHVFFLNVHSWSPGCGMRHGDEDYPDAGCAINFM